MRLAITSRLLSSLAALLALSGLWGCATSRVAPIQVDTGGFLIYQPPRVDLVRRPDPEVSAWTGPEQGGRGWTADWDLTGFQYVQGAYSGRRWLSKTDTAPLAAHHRPGTKLDPTSTARHGGPLLFVRVDQRFANEGAFRAWVLEAHGVTLGTRSSSAFEVWDVDEALVPR